MNKDITYWVNLLTNISAWSSVLPVAAGFYRFRRLTPVAKVVLFFVIIAWLFELLSSYVANQGTNNTNLVPYWVAIETIFLAWIFRLTLKGVWKKVLVMVTILILLTTLGTILFWSESDTFSSNLRLVQTGIFILVILIYFYQLFDQGDTKALGKDPMFWFGTAFFIYFCGNLFFFIALGIAGNDGSQENINTLSGLFIIHSLVMIIRNILLTIGFLKIPK